MGSPEEPAGSPPESDPRKGGYFFALLGLAAALTCFRKQAKLAT
ncbi:hypothetical protein ABZZ47_09480 [Streptomyces sp. NPDC006465]